MRARIYLFIACSFISPKRIVFVMICVAAIGAEESAESVGELWGGSLLSFAFLSCLNVRTVHAVTEFHHAYSSYSDELRVVAQNLSSATEAIENDIEENVSTLIQIRNTAGLESGFKKYLSDSLYPHIAATRSLIKVLGSGLHFHVQAPLLKLILQFKPYLNYMLEHGKQTFFKGYPCIQSSITDGAIRSRRVYPQRHFNASPLNYGGRICSA